MDFLNSILDHIDEAVIITDAQGKILFFNEPALTKSKELFLANPLREGENLVNIATPERRDAVRGILQEIQLKKQSVKTFAQYTTTNGTVYLELNYVPVISKEGDLTHIHQFTRDMTQQKVFEQRLTTLAANTSNLIQKANAVIIGVDTRGYITDWNEHCLRITGYEKNNVYSQKFVNVLLDRKETVVFDELMGRVLNNESVNNCEIAVHTRAGKIVTLLLSGTPRTTARGDVIGVTFVGQDVTELSEYRKSLEMKVEERTSELKRALKKEKEVVEMKNRFVSIASHEFRTPLSSIQFATNFIKQHNKRINEGDLYEKLNNIEKQVQRMTSLLDDVLTYGKGEAGKIQLIVSTIKLTDFINSIVGEVGLGTKSTHTVKSDFSQTPEEISTDEKLLRNVLINLLTNAIKFSPGRDIVYLTVHGIEDQLRISIRDEGIGIPSEEIEKIFEPFIRGKAAAAIQGTGLGLSIVKKAVELLNGTIRAESQPGSTTFIVTIPTHQE